MLPYQSPLYRAIDSIRSDDLENAEEGIKAYFAALETDTIAQSCRRQHNDRQVFEADFVSILVTEEIDAWSVLAVVNMRKEDWEAAFHSCCRQLDLIDQYYGHKTPSLKLPERVPQERELHHRFLLTASHLAIIYGIGFNDDQLRHQWKQVSLLDLEEPAYLDSNSRYTDEGLPPGLNKFEFSDWSIRPVDKNGTTWLANIYSRLTERTSPRKFNTLLKVHLPTEPEAEIPSKALRWRIWRLRQLLAMRFEENRTGIFFGELQTRGQRILLFYVQDADAARFTTADIVVDAAELSPRIEIEPDLAWNEYSFWSGHSIGVTESSVAMPEASTEEPESDSFLRRVWPEFEDAPSLWSRVYDLLWMINVVPPQTVAMKKYCVDYIFELLDSLSPEERSRGLWHTIWKIPDISLDAALRALDLIPVGEIPDEHQCTANFGAEALAELDPTRAYAIVEQLKKVDYSLIHKPVGKIANTIAKQDRERAKQIVEDTRDFILGCSEQPYSKATYLGELADTVGVALPDLARELLIEAMDLMPQIDERSTRSQIFHGLAHAAKNVSPDLLQPICEGALQAAYALAAPSTHWMDFGGPDISICKICWLIPYFAAYNKATAVEVLNQAIDLTSELDDNDRFELLPQLAIGAIAIGAPENRKVAERIWNLLESTGNDGPIALRVASPRNPNPVVDFFEMNPTLASEHLDTLFRMCDGSGVSEHQVEVLCRIALRLSSHREAASLLLERAALKSNKCSSKYLRALSLMKVVHAMKVLELDSLRMDALETGAEVVTLVELEQDVNNVFDKVNAPNYSLLVELAAYFAPLDRQMSERCIDKILYIARFDVAGFEPSMAGTADHHLNQLPPDQLFKLFYGLVKQPQEEDSQQTTSLRAIFKVFNNHLSNARSRE